MRVQPFAVGAFATNCYVASCGETREAVIVDPDFNESAETKIVFSFIDKTAQN